MCKFNLSCFVDGLAVTFFSIAIVAAALGLLHFVVFTYNTLGGCS